MIADKLSYGLHNFFFVQELNLNITINFCHWNSILYPAEELTILPRILLSDHTKFASLFQPEEFADTGTPFVVEYYDVDHWDAVKHGQPAKDTTATAGTVRLACR